jgi:hypothetical protein
MSNVIKQIEFESEIDPFGNYSYSYSFSRFYSITFPFIMRRCRNMVEVDRGVDTVGEAEGHTQGSMWETMASRRGIEYRGGMGD